RPLQAAGRIVTATTLKIAELYHEEESAAGRPPKIRGHAPELPIGKTAIAEAAGMARRDLNGLTFAVEATERQRERAIEASPVGTAIPTGSSARVGKAPMGKGGSSRARAPDSIGKSAGATQ